MSYRERPGKVKQALLLRRKYGKAIAKGTTEGYEAEA